MCYVQEWFSATNAVEAPLNDILFIKKLNDYKKYDEKVAETALKKFLNHLWYLSEECVVFSLFDNGLNLEEKRRMAEKLMEKDYTENVDDEIRKKRYMEVKDVPNFICKDLPAELFSPKSIKLFRRFGLSDEFLLVDPVLWENQQSYLQGQQILDSLKVVNDTAERGVKLMEEFSIKLQKNEEQK